LHEEHKEREEHLKANDDDGIAGGKQARITTRSAERTRSGKVQEEERKRQRRGNELGVRRRKANGVD